MTFPSSPSAVFLLLPVHLLLMLISAVVFIIFSQCCGCCKKKQNGEALPPPPPQFTMVGGVPVALAPGQTAAVGVQFVPKNDSKYETLASLDANIFVKSGSPQPAPKEFQSKVAGSKFAPTPNPQQAKAGGSQFVPKHDPKYETLARVDPNIFVKNAPPAAASAAPKPQQSKAPQQLVKDSKYQTLAGLDANIFVKNAPATPAKAAPQAPVKDSKYQTLAGLDHNIFVKK
ncbi:hypothetical protein niasHT_038493 [Heterodera trifolii]|uniref:Uncharacterized protein n=1 Tax=Heterodera trifolii TaxID=157864 RepID=A0ABD2IW74_9BILA